MTVDGMTRRDRREATPGETPPAVSGREALEAARVEESAAAPRVATSGPGRVPPGGTPHPGAGASAPAAPDAPDADERRRLVERYAHLVKYVVGRLGVAVPGVFDHDDAMQAGAIGLLQAIDAYRSDGAASFESYALLRIRGSILDAVRAIDSIGRTGREAARAIERALSDLYARLGRTPDEWEVAEHLHLSLERYQEQLKVASVVTVSLDEQEDRETVGEVPTLADTVPDQAAPDPVAWLESRETLARLSAAVAELSQRQQTVLALYYQDELTLREIGEVLGVTESRICQIHAEAILALRGRFGGSLTTRPVRRPRRAGRPGGRATTAVGPAGPRTDPAGATRPSVTEPAGATDVAYRALRPAGAQVPASAIRGWWA